MTDTNTTVIADATEGLNGEQDLYMEAVVAFVIIQEDLDDGTSAIHAEPLTVSYEGDVGDYLGIEKYQKVISLIPAPKGSYSVHKWDSKGESHHLGYKYPGSYFP